MTKSQLVHLHLEVDCASVIAPRILYTESINGETIAHIENCNGRILIAFKDGSVYEFLSSVRRTLFGFALSSLVKRTSSSPIRLMRYDKTHNYLYTVLENERICVYSLQTASLQLLDTIESLTEAAQTVIGNESDWKIVGLDFLPYGLAPFPIIVVTTRNGTRFFLYVRDNRFQHSLVRFSSQNEIIVNSTAVVGGTFVQITSPNQVLLTTRCSSQQPMYLEVCEVLKAQLPVVEQVYSLPELQFIRKTSQHRCELRFW